MNTLLLDTSCERGFAALTRGDRLIAEKRLSIGLFSSREVVKATHDLLDESGLDFSNLKAIAIGVGPGSFTGIRVGAAFALGLVSDHTLPLISFSSLLGFTSEKKTFLSFIPAKVGGIYGQIRKRVNGEIVEERPPQFFSPEQYEEAFSSCECAISPTAYSHPSFHLPLVVCAQDLSFIANYVERKYAQKNFSEKNLEILYVRPCPYST